MTLTEYNQLIRYNNELYKLTAATDIPFTTAGNTDETWTSIDAAHFVSVGDAALRQSLASSEKGSGGSMIELEQEGTVQGALTNVFLVSDADNTGASDVTAKIQSWIDKAAAIGGGTVDIPKGTFLCASYSNQVILPGDDGTAAPAWVAAGTDANIAPEATHTMYAALKILM
ncbi:hypothetical protein [Klebsiella michiganensis]|uniref:hypothetical protein n=1 Tax=Klebsiella michiganensis TaxID=1134687 RepID=UPI001D11B6F4|nr:hypothetical protein [Klebsiella michiganensis]MDK3154777.1 hypothetical protein [Klebsiella michiganensis]MDV1381318.1 hypothetical protein [Klebsiella michiganensis]MDV1435167.1 hypothetical protein [Klebsiella michiganensis]MDV1951957.1 hypothetical protein [Klebsiella michiganensis]UDV45745.1 hypothetical protein LJU40_17990 [Klebsiella michiganensis]